MQNWCKLTPRPATTGNPVNATTRCWRAAGLVLIIAAGLGGLPLQAADTPRADQAVAPPSTLTVEQVDSQIAETEANQNLDSAVKAKLLALYQSAAGQLQDALRDRAKVQSLKALARHGPADIETLHRQLAAVGMPAVIPANLSDSALQRDLTKAQSDLATINSEAQDLARQLQNLQARPQSARQELAETTGKLQQIDSTLEKPAANGPPHVLIEAQTANLQAQRIAGVARRNRINQELSTQDIHQRLLQTQSDLANKRYELATSRVRQLQARLTQRRRRQATQAANAAAREHLQTAGQNPLLGRIAQQNAEYSAALATVTADQQRATAQQSAIQQDTKQIANALQSARQQLEIAGVSPALGQILREQRRNLPEQSRFTAERRDTVQHDRIAQTGLAEFTAEQRLRELADIDAAVDRLMTTELSPAPPASDRQTIHASLVPLLTRQHEILETLAPAYGSYLRTLGGIEFAQQQRKEQSAAFAAYLDGKLLWIPSAPPISLQTFGRLGEAATWLLDPAQWLAAAHSLVRNATDAYPLTILFIVVAYFLGRTRLRMRKTLTQTAVKVGRLYTDRFVYTLETLLATVLLAVPFALLLGFVGWLLHDTTNHTTFDTAIAAACYALVLPLFVLRFTYHLCRPDGLALAHFAWSRKSVRPFRRHIVWFTVFLGITIFISAATAAAGRTAYDNGLGRLAVMAGLIAAAVVTYAVVNPNNGLVARYLATNSQTWVAKLRYLWFPLSIGIPIALVLLAAQGYLYTTLQLQKRLGLTLLAIFAAIVLFGLAKRWLKAAAGQLAIRQRREEYAAARIRTSDSQTEAAAAALDTGEPDIAVINAQSLLLLKNLLGWSLIIGIWLIWAEVLPALNVLDSVTLWQYTSTANGAQVVEAITLGNVVFALVAAVIIIAAARNFPGLLEIAVLQRLPLAFGSRYAIANISRYLIVGIGVSIILTKLGFGWGRLQWLVAAVGVGLGFGLQEIFANFVAGIIMLFERPVRVGDTVTVGSLTGTVSRIRIRATTLTDWDNKEIIVPNKTFITDQLINWTLTDTVVRIVIPIGIVHGSDTRLAYQTIKQTADRQPLALRDPAPQVVLLGFGNSALNFELRIYVKSLTDYLQATHELHMQIDQALRAAGIEIARPHRNLQIRSTPPEFSAVDHSPARPA